MNQEHWQAQRRVEAWAGKIRANLVRLVAACAGYES